MSRQNEMVRVSRSGSCYVGLMEPIVPGVYQVPGFSRSFLIDGDEGVTLVDTGLPKRHRTVLKALDDIGRTPTDVRRILITHSHSDHVGGAAALQQATKAPLYASEADAPAVRGDAPSPPPPRFAHTPFLRLVFRLVPGADPATVDHYVAEGRPTDLPGDLSMIDTPGHTPGHVSYLLDRSGGVLFVGDAAVVTKTGEVKRGWMNRPAATVDASLRHLAGFEFEVALFGHSARLVGGASAAFRRFTDRL